MVKKKPAKLKQKKREKNKAGNVIQREGGRGGRERREGGREVSKARKKQSKARICTACILGVVFWR